MPLHARLDVASKCDSLQRRDEVPRNPVLEGMIAGARSPQLSRMGLKLFRGTRLEVGVKAARFHRRNHQLNIPTRAPQLVSQCSNRFLSVGSGGL